jgi:hypothetical protein
MKTEIASFEGFAPLGLRPHPRQASPVLFPYFGQEGKPYKKASKKNGGEGRPSEGRNLWGLEGLLPSAPTRTRYNPRFNFKRGPFMEEKILFFFLGFLIFIPIFSIFHMRKIKNTEIQHKSIIDKMLFDFNEKEEKLNTEIQKAKDHELTVLAYPWKEEHGDDGWISDDRSVKVGYQYQLFIRGIPCFEPHKVVLEHLHKKQTNPKKVAQALEQSLTVIQAIASKHPAIQIASKIPN